MSTSPASQDIEKLAVIPRFLYSDCDFGGVELPPYIDLRAFSTSLSGGEKPANLGLSRLTTPFREVVGSALLAGAMIASPAMAKDDNAGPPVATAPVSVAVQPVAFSPLQKREAPYCSALKFNDHGLSLNDTTSAFRYSEENIGAVGISIAPGNDLNGYTPEQLGTHFVNLFADLGVEAECFIRKTDAPNGTAIGFNVNGLVIKQSPDHRFFNLEQALNPENIKELEAEAKMGKRLLGPTASLGAPDSALYR